MFTEGYEKLKDFFRSKEMDMSLLRRLSAYCYKEYKMPMKQCLKYATTGLKMADENEVFMIADSLDHISNSHFVADCFSAAEIQGNANLCYVEKKENIFPLKVKCVSLSDREWIGKMTVEMLNLLYEKNYLYHNAKELAKLLGREDENYVYHGLEKCVKRTVHYLESDEFIPPVIVLNSYSCDYSYDEDNSELTINNLDRFFVANGLETIMALTRANADLKNLVLPVRITLYSFEDESRYIRQETERKFVIMKNSTKKKVE